MAFPSDAFTLPSADTGLTYEITVEVPNRYPTSDRRYPLVVCLDGQWTYGVVRDAFRIMPLDRELPEAIVVGVAHAAESLREIVQLRAIDYTPTEYTSPPMTGVRLAASEVGRAHVFRRFLLDEVLALVDERYRTSGERAVVGHSFSALFGLDTLLLEPDAFDRWVLTSPSVWWDDRVMFERERKHAAVTDDVNATVFMSAGGDEGGEGFGGQHDFYLQFTGRGYPSLTADWHLFEGESHQSVIAPAVTRGLRTVFRQ